MYRELYPTRYKVNEMGTNEKSNLLKKISGLRQEIMTKDWADDKMFTMNGRGGYSYLSADKVKKTLAPLFSKHGIELRVEFNDLQCREAIGNMSQHWTVRLDVTMIDVENGDTMTSSVYGEAGDSGDKGVSKAQTCAVKQWVFSEFFIADGIDPDAADGMVNTSGFYKKSADEKEEVVSKVLAQSMKPAQTEKPVEEAKPAKSVKTPAKKAAEPKAEEKPAEEPAKPAEEAKPVEAEAKSEVKSYKPTGPQAKAIKRIEEVWEQRAKSGEVTPEEYNAMSMARASLSSPADAVAFIKTYKVG